MDSSFCIFLLHILFPWTFLKEYPPLGPPRASFEKHFVLCDMLCSGMQPVLIFQTNGTLIPKYAFNSPASLMNTMVIVGLISLQFMIEGNIDHHTATAAVPAVVAHLSTVS